MEKKSYSLKQIADFLGAKLSGDPNAVVVGIAPLDKATASQISFLDNPQYRKFLPNTQAGAIVLKEEFAKLTTRHCLIVDDPYVAYAKISALFVLKEDSASGIHATAIIGKDCIIDPSVSIGAYSVLGSGVHLGKNVKIAAHCILGDAVEINDNTKLYPNVNLYRKVKVGKNCLIHSGAVIGADGFGMANDRGKWVKIEQLGNVIIGDDVEIGANTTIDRGALEDTIIGDGVKIDNLVQIGHNVTVGANTVIAGCAGIAGSTKIGKNCLIGGAVGVSGHLEIVDGVILTAKTGVARSILAPGIYSSGINATPHRTWLRVVTHLHELDDIARRLKLLEKKT